MCDYGRYNYEWFNNSENRIEAPLVRDGGRLVATGWQQAVTALVERLQSMKDANVSVIGSPFHANEDNALLLRLAHVLGTANATYQVETAEEVVCPGFPKLARRKDLAANVKGLDVMGFKRGAPAGGSVVIALGDPGENVNADLFIQLGTVGAKSNADFVLPVTFFAEQEGTFTNFEGRVQRFWPGMQAPPLARPAWQILGVILAGLGDGDAPASAAHAFLLTGQHFDAFAGLSYDVIGSRGALINDTVKIGGGARA
jgi:NADH-quinone oxidoreductase subunit G